jgi:hypothetical protein
MLIVIGVAAFLGGCWVGMGSDSSGESYCVVTDASAPAHPGLAPGQLADMPAAGCLPGEQEVCGSFEGSGEDRKFVSDTCSDD